MLKEPQFSAHIAEDVLEEYAFGRLAEAKTGQVEEHLLVCEACQEALADVDQYILLMKAATTRPFGFAPKRAPFRYARAGLAAAAGLMIAILALPKSTPRTEVVTLVAMRGQETARLHAGAAAEFRIDLPDLPDATYRLEIVDSSGRRVWSGGARSLRNKMRVVEPRALRAGIYWVRLYSAAGELLREFGLESF